MISKFLFTFSLFVFCQINSQIKIDFDIDYLNKMTNVILVNENNYAMAIPLDRSSLRPFFNDICLDIKEYAYKYPSLGLNIKLEQDNNILESSVTGGIPSDLGIIKRESKVNKIEKRKFEKSIKSWQKKNDIKSFDDAKINYYIFNNLIYLKPGEKVNLVYHFDLNNITNEKYMNYFYHIEDNKNYNVTLYFEMNECIYDFLTKSQKEKMANYNLFIGKIESNKIKLKQ